MKRANPSTHSKPSLKTFAKKVHYSELACCVNIRWVNPNAFVGCHLFSRSLAGRFMGSDKVNFMARRDGDTARLECLYDGIWHGLLTVIVLK